MSGHKLFPSLGTPRRVRLETSEDWPPRTSRARDSALLARRDLALKAKSNVSWSPDVALSGKRLNAIAPRDARREAHPERARLEAHPERVPLKAPPGRVPAERHNLSGDPCWKHPPEGVTAGRHRAGGVPRQGPCWKHTRSPQEVGRWAEGLAPAEGRRERLFLPPGGWVEG